MCLQRTISTRAKKVCSPIHKYELPLSESDQIEQAIRESLITLHHPAASGESDIISPTLINSSLEDEDEGTPNSKFFGGASLRDADLPSPSLPKGPGEEGFLRVIQEPAGDDITTTPEKMDTGEALSEASSQEIESDFNLIMTESDSEPDLGVAEERRREEGGKEEEEREEGRREEGGFEAGMHAQLNSVTLWSKGREGMRGEGGEEEREGREEVGKGVGEKEDGRLEIEGGEEEGAGGGGEGEVLGGGEEMREADGSVLVAEATESDVNHPVCDTTTHSVSLVTMATQLPQETPPTSFRVLQPQRLPPTKARLCETAVSYGVPLEVHTKPFYGNPVDVQMAR